jgi:TorA maturation chaperone TorD
MKSSDCRNAADMLRVFKQVMFAPGKTATWQNLLEWAQSHGETSFAASLETFALRLDDLEAEFNRLCVGPHRKVVPPYESVWTGARELYSRMTVSVAWFYAQAGLITRQKTFNEPADFFGSELEFLECLMTVAAEAPSSPNTDIKEVIEFSEAFWAEHLGHWAAPFLDAMASNSREHILSAWAEKLNHQLQSCFGNIALQKPVHGIERLNESIPIYKDSK